MGADQCLALVLGQRVGGLVEAMMQAAGNYRLIRIAIDEVHHNFLANPGKNLAAPEVAGPGLGHAEPAGILVFPVPVEAHLDIAILVGIDLLAGGPDDHSRLRISVRFGAKRWTIGLVGRERDEFIMVMTAFRPGIFFQNPRLAALMADFQEQIGTVVFGQGMQFQLEHSSGSQVGQVALSPSYIRRQASVKTRNVIKNGETSLIEDNPDLSTVAQLDRLMLPSKPDIWPVRWWYCRRSYLAGIALFKL